MHSACLWQDVECAVAALREGRLPGLATSSGCLIGLWGLREGALAALHYASKDPTVAALITLSLRPPQPLELTERLRQMIWRTETLLEVAQKCFVPAFFLAGPCSTSCTNFKLEDLRSHYGGEAQIGHSVARAALFLARAFGLDNAAVTQLDAYLTKLAKQDRRKCSDEQAEEFLRSNEAEKCLLGLLQKAANACSCQSSFGQSLARGQISHWESRGVLRYAICLQLANFDAEVCIAWATKTEHNSDMVGLVHFMNVSCTSLSISRAVIREGHDGHGHRVAVQDLMVKEWVKTPWAMEVKFLPERCQMRLRGFEWLTMRAPVLWKQEETQDKIWQNILIYFGGRNCL